MTLTIAEDVKAKAEMYHGDAVSQEKTQLLLQEVGLPNGLLPLKDIIECGYVEETGFVWLKQRKKIEHCFEKVGRQVSYAAEISAYAEKGRLKKITGVKAKELLLWVSLHEICVDEPPTGKLTCKAIGGLFRSFPVEAFEIEGKKKVVEEGKSSEKESKEEDKEKTEEAAAVTAVPASATEVVAAKN